MRSLAVVLTLLLLLTQYRLWLADGSLAEKHRLQAEVVELQNSNRSLQHRNAALERDVVELKSGHRGIEQRARTELGLVREGEVFYQIVDPGNAPAGDALRSDPAVQPQSP